MARVKLLGHVDLVVRDVRNAFIYKRFSVSETNVSEAIRSILEEGVFERDTPSDDQHQRNLFSFQEKKKRKIPTCGAVSGVLPEKRKMHTTALSEDRVFESLNDLSICVACCFSRNGYKDMYTIEQLSRVRLLVVDVLERAQYKIERSTFLSRAQSHNWVMESKWACLARVSGLEEDRVFVLTSAARRVQRLVM